MPDKLFLLMVNPAAGISHYQEKLDIACSILKKGNFNFLIYTSEKISPEAHLRTYLNSNPSITHVIIIGGDGSINLTLNALPHFGYTLGFLCNGTGNDSVKPHKLPNTTEKQVATILQGGTKTIDLGRCNGRYFMNGIGIGFDGEVVNEISRQKRKKKGHWAYLSAVLKLMTGKWRWPVMIALDSNKIKREIFSITVAKGTTFGGGFVMNPHAKSDDGFLDICIFNNLSLFKRLYILPMVQLGIHGKAGDVNFFKSKRISISSSLVINAHIDGEPLQSDTFEIEVIPKAIKILL